MTDGMCFFLYAPAKDNMSIPTTMFFCLAPLYWLVGRLVLAREWCLRCICSHVLFTGSILGQCSNEVVVVRRCVKPTNKTASQEGPGRQKIRIRIPNILLYWPFTGCRALQHGQRDMAQSSQSANETTTTNKSRPRLRAIADRIGLWTGVVVGYPRIVFLPGAPDRA